MKNSKSSKNKEAEEAKKLEKELVNRCKLGDPLAFDQLMKINGAKIKGWCMKYCAENESQVDEVYQLTMIKCWNKISQFKGTSSFLTWANAIARNNFYDIKRAEARRIFLSMDATRNTSRHTDSGDLAPASIALSATNQLKYCGYDVEESSVANTIDDPSAETLGKESKKTNVEAAERILGKLSVDHSRVLRMFEYDELTYSQIAEKLGVSEGTVMSRIYYARKNGKKYLPIKK